VVCLETSALLVIRLLVVIQDLLIQYYVLFANELLNICDMLLVYIVILC